MTDIAPPMALGGGSDAFSDDEMQWARHLLSVMNKGRPVIEKDGCNERWITVDAALETIVAARRHGDRSVLGPRVGDRLCWRASGDGDEWGIVTKIEKDECHVRLFNGDKHRVVRRDLPTRLNDHDGIRRWSYLSD